MSTASSVSLSVAFIVLLTIAWGHGGVVKRSDDVSIQSLEKMVQQQASALQTLQADIAALKSLTTDVNNLSYKVATLSKRVAFTVRFTADDVDGGIALGANPILQFDNVVTNVGNGYNSRTGIFTAPVAGIYTFFLTEMAPNQHGSLNLDIMKENQVLDETWAPGSLDPDDQGSSSLVTTQLAEGQQVWVRHRGGDAVRGGYWTIFTGFLLQAE